MWLDVVIVLVACLVAVVAYFRGHAAGYCERALEDKNAMVTAAVARFRAERTAEVYRQRAVMLLRMFAPDRDRDRHE